MAVNLLDMTISGMFAVLCKRWDSHHSKMALMSGFDHNLSLMGLSTINVSYYAHTIFWLTCRNLRDLSVNSLENGLL